MELLIIFLVFFMIGWWLKRNSKEVVENFSGGLDDVLSGLAHFLNNVFDLPHPGPNDPQGACWCRKHEGRNKYTFTDYIKSL